MKCVRCKATIPENISKCPKCGMIYNTCNITEENYQNIRICVKCHAIIGEHETNCKMCGQIYNDEKTDNQANFCEYQSKNNLISKVQEKGFLTVIRRSIIAFVLLTLVMIFSLIMRSVLNNNVYECLIGIISFFPVAILIFFSLFLINLGYFCLIGYKKTYGNFRVANGYIVDNRVSNQLGSDNIEYHAIIEYVVDDITYRKVSSNARRRYYPINRRLKLSYKDGFPLDCIILENYFSTGVIALALGFTGIIILICSILS